MKIKNINKGVLASFVLVALIGYSTMNGDDSFTSNLIQVSFFLVPFLYFIGLNNKKVSKEYYQIVNISIVLCFLGVIISGWGNFDYFKKLIMYSTTLMWIAYGCSCKVSKMTIMLSLIPVLILNFLYFYFFSSGISLYEGETLLTLNFSNPNLTGMFIMNSVSYAIMFCVGIREFVTHKWIRLIFIILAIYLTINIVGLLLMTGCRSAIMSVALLIILIIYDFYRKGHVKLKKWQSLLIAMMPFIFVFLYLTYVDYIDFDVSFGHEDSGKDIGTRIKIWQPIVDNFFDFFFFGDYYGISNGTGMSQMHNTHLDVYASYGFVPLILYILLIFRSIWYSWKQATTRFKRCAIYAFISCQLSYMFEAGFVSGSAGMYLLTVGFLIFANYNESTTS